MKRRRFIQTLAATPVAAVPIVSEATASPIQAQQARPAEDAPNLEISVPDVAAEMTPKFFNAQQFAALRKLSEILTPAYNNLPGALEAGVPEFLDFLIGASPADRRQIYTAGLDALNAQARKRFNKPFAEISETQAGELLAPLRQPWTYEPPADPLARFLREAKQDVRTATQNSREYINAAAAGGRRGGGVGQYWYPID
jgi:hypothetical protein